MSLLPAKTLVVCPHSLPRQDRDWRGSRKAGVSDHLLHQAGGGASVSNSLILVDEEEFESSRRDLGEGGIHSVDVEGGGIDE